MDTSHLVDLYLAESHEHLRALNRALLDLEEADEPGPAIEEAFRSAHTIKGAASMLGFGTVAGRAHELENRLEALRAGEVEVDADVVEELLAKTDALEAAVNESVESGGGEVAAAGASGGADEAAEAASSDAADVAERTVRGAGRAPKPPAGAAYVVRVELRDAARLKGARALVVLRRVGAIAPLLGSRPRESELGDRFGGVLWLFLGGAADPEEVEAAIREAGEVEQVAIETPPGDDRGSSADGGEDAGGSARAGRSAADGLRRAEHVRVLRSHLDDLADGIGELAILWRRLRRSVIGADADRADEAVESLASEFDRRMDDLQYASLAVRMVPVAALFDRFPRVVRDAARALDKRVDFRIEGRDIELDRALLDEISDPLLHLLRNAVAHGLEVPEARRAAGKPERGRLTLRASRERAGVLVEVVDDGAGLRRDRILERGIEAGLVDPENPPEVTDDVALRLLSRPGVSTAERVSDVAGRGVGLDVVTRRVRALGGAVGLRSEEGEGTTFTLRLPLTFVVAETLHVTVADEDYLIPLTHLKEAVELAEVEVVRVRGEEFLRLRDELVPLVRLRAALGTELDGEGGAGDDDGEDGGRGMGSAIVAELAPRRAALAVDGIVGRERIIVKDFDSPRGLAPYFSGATLLADGRPALVVDPIGVL
ncbi:MAG: chemotaxis protein CheA [Gemmatimonadota bacterium]